MKNLILSAIFLLAIGCSKDHEHAIECETVTIETKDYHDNGLLLDAVGYYDLVTHEFEDCY